MTGTFGGALSSISTGNCLCVAPVVYSIALIFPPRVPAGTYFLEFEEISPASTIRGLGRTLSSVSPGNCPCIARVLRSSFSPAYSLPRYLLLLFPIGNPRKSIRSGFRRRCERTRYVLPWKLPICIPHVKRRPKRLLLLHALVALLLLPLGFVNEQLLLEWLPLPVEPLVEVLLIIVVDETVCRTTAAARVFVVSDPRPTAAAAGMPARHW